MTALRNEVMLANSGTSSLISMMEGLERASTISDPCSGYTE